MHPTQQFLNKLLVHTRLTLAEEDAVRSLPGTVVALGDRAAFVRRGEEVKSSCIVIAGMVARIGRTNDGNVQFAALYLPGDMPDIYALLVPHSLITLEAVCDTNILRIPRGAMRDIVLKHPGVAEAFWRETMMDTSIATEWMVNLGQRTGKERVAHLLCELAWRLADDRAEAFSFCLPLNQEQLGATTGMSAVHVNRVLHDLRDDRAVRLTRSQAHVEDWSRLKAIAGFDPAYLLTPSIERITPAFAAAPAGSN